MPELIEAIFIQGVKVVDPETKGEVAVGIWKDPVSGGIFGLDESFVHQMTEQVIPSPFDRKIKLRLPSQPSPPWGI